ncbi:MAG: methyltransferase domain-containing protein [Gemmatimonadaceae bacterium]|nr:methyltransferase domain-containing protein [Gemmatimonadaceae bacterium]
MSHEASKAARRRMNDRAFTEVYFTGAGIDIGAGPDGLSRIMSTFPKITSVRDWDLPDGDAMLMAGVPDASFDFVHSSHCLEHLHSPTIALTNWLRIVKPGGYVVVTIPEEDMYEQGIWPSTFNPDHKFTFTTLKGKSWSPRSVSVALMLAQLVPVPEIVKLEIIHLDYDWEGERRDLTYLSHAECAIEFVLRRRTDEEIAAGGRLRRAAA